MPSFLVLQERDAGAFHRLGQDGQRLRAQAHRGKHFGDLLQIMAIDLLGAPAEGLKAPFVGAKVTRERRGLALAEPVDIHNRDEVVQVVDACQRGRLPDRAFRAFAIAEQHIGPVVQVVQLRAQRHAHPDRQPLAQRPGRHIHEWQARCRMAFEVAAELTQLEQLLHRKQPRLRPGRIQQGRGMAFGKNEPVVVVEVRVLGIVAHVSEEQGRYHICR